MPVNIFRQWWVRYRNKRDLRILLRYCRKRIYSLEQEYSELKNEYFGDYGYKPSDIKKEEIIDRLIMIDTEIDEYKNHVNMLINKIETLKN